MKQAKYRSESTTLEHLSFTLVQINQDASGKQTVNRTYWSNRKKTNLPVKSTTNLLLEDSQNGAKSTHHDAEKREKPNKKFIQMSLFPT